jgi:para-nitrobenzyl esterase
MREGPLQDCLYLNVFAPSRATGRALPVMVWIHGGSLLTGESDDFDPAALVRDGVIVVTINYRIGALGFLADSALAAIRGFGGNPRDVTLFGESAGGLSTLAQLVSA